MTRYRIVAAAGIAMTFLAVASGASAVPLTLTGPIQDDTFGPQSTSNPCIIAGTACSQPAGFGFNNFTNSGAISSYDMFSTAVDGGNNGTNVPDGVQGTPYTVSQLPSSFNIAIDVNTTKEAGETLQLFH